MSAIAVHRCSRHSCSPLRALPRWRTRRSTDSSRSAVEFDKEREFAISDLLGQKHVEPGEHGQQDGRGEHDVAAAINAPDLEAVASIPGATPHAAAQLTEEGGR